MEIIAAICIGFVALWVLLALFEPAPKYRVTNPPAAPLDSAEFARILSAVSDARLVSDNRVEVLTNGDAFYTAELEAINAAQKNVNFEAYIFHRGEITRRFVDAFTQAARRGVEVRLVLDGAGSATTQKDYFKDLIAAGGKVEWYHPLRFRNAFRYNNRTHRELMVVDGVTGFLGGAGVADHWYKSTDKSPRWRDTMFRLHGEAVSSLQGTFTENWLEASGEIISGDAFFPPARHEGSTAGFIVNSTPSQGASTRNRVLYQVLIASARESIYITTPYFLPDKHGRDELLRAIHRGVKVKILVPGKRSDHAMTRSSSRAAYGELLKAGAEIYEYQPAMIHAKVLIVDGLWSVVGSTNFDSRSFALNDEVNLAARDPELAARLAQDFAADLAQSQQISYEQWANRSVWERGTAMLGWLLQRQQ